MIARWRSLLRVGRFVNSHRIVEAWKINTQEEKWAYRSRHIQVNRYDPGPGQVYRDLLGLVSGKAYYVITTHVDAQFEKAGFPKERIFAVQGDYGKLQCAKACHRTLYDNEAMIRQMVSEQRDCRIPSHLVPRCPRCGEFMEPNLRKDQFFVEDDARDPCQSEQGSP